MSDKKNTGVFPDAVELARFYHDTRERLAPRYRHDVPKDSEVPWDMVPTMDRALMIATAERALRWLRTGRR